ncbi:hypothetical protein [Bacillus sp. AFS040349]|uniref:hypothetical protein n=1 Tax=Bacillus sp. AFS040349 TaxID=2033502 RepID=UPI000BFB9320|nr:hypothetical protein [Bacillus sp. AFS040349]PGT83246.1 hypothetical protein COD11_12995 [Bacillus sp. AFS040349]
MNKEMFFSLVPKEVIKEEDTDKRINEQRKIIENGKSFVSQLSINQCVYKNLVDFDIDERLNLFDNLRSSLIINEHGMYFYDLDTESFGFILEETFNLENMYELDNLYIENLLNGRDITKEEIFLYEGRTMIFKDILEQFVFSSGMPSGNDLMLMLTVKKALLGSFLAEKNIESLLKGQKEIYDISILV